MRCHEVQEQLDLLAARECDRPTEQALQRHLADCPACAASFAESQRLLGLLDLHWNTAGLERLHERIEAEARRPHRRAMVLPFVRQAAALAAMLLLMLGLTWLLPRWPSEESRPGLQLAAVVVPEGQRKVGVRASGHVEAPSAAVVEKAQPEVVLPLMGPKGAALRQELLGAEAVGKLPPPPEVPLALVLKNSGRRPVHVRLGDMAKLSLEVQGDGVLRVRPAGASEPGFLHLDRLVIPPGGQRVFPIDRLIAGARGQLEYIYLIEPGQYTLTAHLRLRVDGRVVTLASERIRIKVRD
jgi:hypothetical protein